MKKEPEKFDPESAAWLETIVRCETNVRIGQTVLVLTRGYHWVGRIGYCTALRIVLVQATLFVDIGQVDRAARGEWQDAHGRQFPPQAPVDIARMGAEIADWPYPLPERPIGD